MFGSLTVRAKQRHFSNEVPAEITRFRTQKTAALLAYLAFFPGPHSRECLIEELWPDSGVETGRNNLRLALSSLRRQLEPPGVPAGSVICSDRQFVELSRKAVTTDVAEFEEALRRAAAATGDEAIPHIQQVVKLYQGRLLAGGYESWIPLEEQRLEAAFFEAFDILIAFLERTGNRSDAIHLLTHALRLDPDRPQTRRVLARVRAGQTKEAEEGPSAPESAFSPNSSPDIVGQPSPFSLASILARLPVALTRFYGRRRELEKLHQFVADSSVRLVTLTGVGGSGKTRLALEAARAHAAEAAGGPAPLKRIEFVSLADLRDALLIPAAIYESLADRKESKIAAGHAAQIAQIVAILATAPTLLILDNFEQLALDGAPLVQILLQSLPALTILATSRQRLNIAGERELPVPPLAVPPLTDEALPSPDPAALMKYESVRMFADRAQSVNAEFEVTQRNAPSVARLVQLLEGVPLALEVAAARLSVLSPAQILRDLQSDTDGKTSNLLDMPDHRAETRERRPTLRATVAWSYHLMPPNLRTLFANLSVFRGGFSPETVRHVCNEPQAVHCLAQLRGASLISFDAAAALETAGPRLRLLESIRDFAADQLLPSEAARLQQRHAEYFLQLAEERAHAGDAAAAEKLDALEVETENFRAALSWLIQKNPGHALRLATALIPLWEFRGYFSEGRRWLEDVAKLSGEETVQTARALGGAGYLAFMESDFPAARAHLERSIELARKWGDDATLNTSLQRLSTTLVNCHDFEAALECSWEVIALNRRIGDPRGVAQSLLNLAIIYVGMSDYASAEGLLQESLRTFQELGDLRNCSVVFDAMGFSAAGTDNLPEARRCWEESLALGRELEDPHLVSKTLCVLGDVSRAMGDLPTARAQLNEALTISQRLNNQWLFPYIMEFFAYLALAEDKAHGAAQILGASEALREELGLPLLPVTLPEYERHVDLLRKRLDQKILEAAWSLGRKLSLDKALNLAVTT